MTVCHSKLFRVKFDYENIVSKASHGKLPPCKVCRP